MIALSFLLCAAGLSPLAVAGVVKRAADPDVQPSTQGGLWFPALPLPTRPSGSNATASQGRTRREFTVRQRCIGGIQLGAGQRSASTNCDGIRYKIWFPATSTCDNNQRSSCGLIFDIHGGTMTADNQNAGSRLRLHGRDAGYIVVNPEKPNKFWDPGVDHAKIVDFLRQAIAAFQPDQRKVHVTGFSQGGFASWRILDLASDVVCSIAPLASSGRDRWGGSYVRNPSSFATGRRGPPTPRSIMYHHGTSDGLSPFSNFNPQVNAILSYYGIDRGSGRRMAGSDRKNTRTVYTGQNGVTVQTGQHDYWSLLTQMGHCFPSTRRRTSANRKSCARWPWRNAYDWGSEVVQFFQANKCPAPSTQCSALAACNGGNPAVTGVSDACFAAVVLTGVADSIAACHATEPQGGFFEASEVPPACQAAVITVLQTDCN